MVKYAESILNSNAILGEGAIWDKKIKALLWVDILAGYLHIFYPSTGIDKKVEVNQYIGTVVPREQGGVVVAMYDGFAFLDLETGKIDFIVDPEEDILDNRFNDGKCDPAGRFWAGTMSLKHMPEKGALYCLDLNRNVKKMLEKVSVSNGITWSLDGKKMYYIDTPLRRVDMFDFDLETGNITNRRIAFEIPVKLGKPDGMTIDCEGKLWIAMWEGWCVTRWDPEKGKLLEKVNVPAARVSSCAFGGEKFDQLYITTAKPTKDDPAQPLAGNLFVIEPGVQGIPAFEYKG